MIRHGLFIPGIKRFLGYLLSNGGLVAIRSIEVGRLLLVDHKLSGRTVDIHFTLEYREISGLGRGIDPEVRCVIKCDRFLREVQRKVIFAPPVDVGHALDEVQLREALARIGECQLIELDRSVLGRGDGADGQGGAVIKHFSERGSAVGVGSSLAPCVP